MNSGRLSELRAGVIAIVPAAIAAVPFGMVLGARAAEKGLSTTEVFIMSATVFAGSAQFVVIDLWDDPAPWLFIALTTLLVNVLHVLMGASLAGKLGAFSPAVKPVAASFLADEIWAMAERRALECELTTAYFAGLAGFLYINWVIWTVAGAAFGRMIDNPEAYGFDFAFTAIFIGILTGFWRGSTTAWVLTVSAAAAVAVKLLVAGPWYIMAGGTAGVLAAMLIWRPERETREGERG